MFPVVVFLQRAKRFKRISEALKISNFSHAPKAQHKIAFIQNIHKSTATCEIAILCFVRV